MAKKEQLTGAELSARATQEFFARKGLKRRNLMIERATTQLGKQVRREDSQERQFPAEIAKKVRHQRVRRMDRHKREVEG